MVGPTAEDLNITAEIWASVVHTIAQINNGYKTFEVIRDDFCVTIVISAGLRVVQVHAPRKYLRLLAATAFDRQVNAQLCWIRGFLRVWP